MMRLRRSPSALFRSSLACLLVLAQLFAVVHALGHAADQLGQGRSEQALSVAKGDGSVPEASRHENCLLCISVAGLSAAPPVSGLRLAVALPALPEWRDSLRPPPARFSFRPPSRGPPLFS